MNYGRIRIAVSAMFALIVIDCVKAVETYGEPPWRRGNRYDVKSTYELALDNIVLDVDVKRGREGFVYHAFFWTSADKVVAHFNSDPFSGKYTCRLNYITDKVEKRGQGGSAFRSFRESDIQFRPSGNGSVVFTKDPGFWRDLFGMDGKKVKVSDITQTAGKSDFYFSQIFDPNAARINYGLWFFIGWKQKDATTPRKNLDVWCGVPIGQPLDTGLDARLEIFAGDPSWKKCSDGDMAYNVIQAEAKLMTYAIYGQTETRRKGEAWMVEADILTAFLPQLDKEDQPFVFDGGSIVLTVTKSENGVQTIEMIPHGVVNGKRESSDLHVKASPNNKYNSTFDPPNLTNQRENYVRFEVDVDHNVCLTGKVNIVLHRYHGSVPKMGQLELQGKTIDGDLLSSRMSDGTVRIHSEIVTDVFSEELKQ